MAQNLFNPKNKRRAQQDQGGKKYDFEYHAESPIFRRGDVAAVCVDQRRTGSIRRPSTNAICLSIEIGAPKID
jgi:hypothetical protein